MWNLFKTKIEKDVDTPVLAAPAENMIRETEDKAFKLYPLGYEFEYLGVMQRVVYHQRYMPSNRFVSVMFSKIWCNYVNKSGDICESSFKIDDLLSLRGDQQDWQKVKNRSCKHDE